MSRRVGAALAAHIRNMPPKDGASKFVLVEGVPVSLAEGMKEVWDAGVLPPLAVVSADPAAFGSTALFNVSGTGLRNKRKNGKSAGVVLVLCEGQQVPDRQSLNLFESVAPSILLDTPAGISLLARQDPAVALDGPARHVRDAINRAGAGTRPSAAAVAAWLDRVAAGEDPLRALPALGGFADHAGGGRIDPDRIGDNLALAARRTGEDLLRPSAYAELRRRMETVLRRRPGLAAEAADEAADEAMALLTNGSPELLERITYDEAHEILEQKAQNLVSLVLTALGDYQRGLPVGGQAAALPWLSYERHAQDLSRTVEQRSAARELLALDEAQQHKVFSRPTRTKLERLLRDRSINGNRPSCPEAALVRATQQLEGIIDVVRVISPRPTVGKANRSSATRQLTLACARLRLGALMRRWEELGGSIDGLLLQPADAGDVSAAFADAAITGPNDLPVLQLQLRRLDPPSSVQVDWKPDLDDIALLRTMLLFAEQPTLTLRLTNEPSLQAFVSGPEPAPEPVPHELSELADALAALARSSLDNGLDPGELKAWAHLWTEACKKQERIGETALAETLALAGAVVGGEHTVGLTPVAPLKAEWLAQYLEALWSLLDRAESSDTDDQPVGVTSAGVARATASHHPGHIRLGTRSRPLLPTSEGRFWSLYGSQHTKDESGYAEQALTAVLERLLTLQPEAAGHLRCLAWGPGAADLLTSTAVGRIGVKTGRAVINKVEIFCIGRTPDDRPSWQTLAAADDALRGSRDVLELRYLDDLQEALDVLPSSDSGAPAVHLALVTGITDGGRRLTINTPTVAPPATGTEVLFAPRTWQQPKSAGRTLLMPPAASMSGQAWLRLQHVGEEDAWPEPDGDIRVPEVRTGALEIADPLRQVHDLALWVATLDRYATRDSLEQALGVDKIAILHQERRLGGDSPLSLVLSQKSGGPADRAIGRSLRAAGIVDNPELALSIGSDIRRVASQGYGILALQAATSGAGINELVGHVVSFSLLANTTTPWPLPPGCRVLLVSLDEYRHWFPGKRADLLAIALDPAEGGVHIAAIEVKARRSDEVNAASGALDQLNQTLAATRWAAYPDRDSIYSRLWLNRIAEAAYSVARESRFRLDASELAALEAFRLGNGTLEWAGVGLVFGPHVTEGTKDYPQQVAGDIVPVVLHTIKLTEALLRKATDVDLNKLRTVQADRPALQGGRVKRRPEARPDGGKSAQNQNEDEPIGASPPVSSRDIELASGEEPVSESQPEAWQTTDVVEGAEAARESGAPLGATPAQPDSGTQPVPTLEQQPFVAPILGWDADTGEEIRWHPAGSGQTTLQNGHVEIWGSSGMGKTQFAMSLLAQLAAHSGSTFGIADFKNDYSSDTGFPQLTGADFIDLWNGGAPYNPLALDAPLGNDDRVAERAVATAVIELRDTVEEAINSVARLGVKQKNKLADALRAAYEVGRSEGRWPTLRTLDDQLDADLAAVIGDLTRHELFKEGPPLGDVIDRNVVFGLSKIPGNGQTTVLAAAFILSSLLLRVQNLPPVPNTVRYVTVVDEAHRVASFKAIKTMIREGRSKGLAVVLATQQPLDLDPVVAANAQTKICFGLPDATVATMAARKLDPDNPRLAEQIRTLGVGEAFLSLAGEAPRLLRMAQVYRDGGLLGLDG